MFICIHLNCRTEGQFYFLIWNKKPVFSLFLVNKITFILNSLQEQLISELIETHLYRINFKMQRVDGNASAVNKQTNVFTISKDGIQATFYNDIDAQNSEIHILKVKHTICLEKTLDFQFPVVLFFSWMIHSRIQIAEKRLEILSWKCNNLICRCFVFWSKR